MKIMRRALTVIVLCAGLAVAGCATTNAEGSAGSRVAGGVVVGGVATGLVCALSGGNTRQCLIAAAAGAVAGGLIAQRLDERDRARHEEALQAALAQPDTAWRNPDAVSTSRVTWVNPDTQNSGEIRLRRQFVDSTAARRSCRTLEDSYTQKGEASVIEATYCQDPNGTWRPTTERRLPT